MESGYCDQRNMEDKNIAVEKNEGMKMSNC